MDASRSGSKVDFPDALGQIRHSGETYVRCFLENCKRKYCNLIVVEIRGTVMAIFFWGKMCVGKKFLSNRTKIEEKFVGGELLFCYHPKKKSGTL